MAERAIYPTVRFPALAREGLPSRVVEPCAKVFLGTVLFLMTLLGDRLIEGMYLSTVLLLPKGVATAAAASTRSSPLPFSPQSFLPDPRSNWSPSQEARKTDYTASNFVLTEAAWARSLCRSAGAKDIERCVRERKMRAGIDAQGRPIRAKHYQDHFCSEDPPRGGRVDGDLLDDSPVLGEHNFQQSFSLLVASYVKFVEAGGHRVIPIPPNASVDRYRKLFLSIDGLLLPGGSAAIHSHAAPYYRATKLFLDWAVEANKSGRYFPVLGICLGFQAMVIWGGGDNFWYFTADDPRNVDRTRQLQFLPAAKTSKLFGPDRSTTAFFPASTEYENGSVRGDETHRASLLNFDASLEQESRSARRGGVPQYAQRWQHVEGAQENQPRTFKDNAEAAMGNVIDKTMLVDLLSREETAYFHHAHRITRAEFDRDAILSQRFALLATVMVPKSGGSEESDADDEFVAIVESTQFPFYGFQFHPEKSLFEHNPFSDVRHDAGSRWVANSLAFFFSNEVGKSTRKSTPFAEEWAHLIQRYTPTDFSSPSAPYAFEEVYFFRNNVESALVHTIE